jgi:hypothetical protein
VSGAPRRTSVVVVVVVLIGALLVGSLAAVTAAAPAKQATPTNNSTATPSPTPTPAPTTGEDAGNWTLAELRQQGTQPASAPSSVRLLDDGAGAVSLRYQPARPLGEGGYQFLSRGQRLETNRIQVYSTVFGESDADWSFVVVSWQPATRQVETDDGVTTQRYAANVTETRYQVGVGPYQTANVTLPGHYDASWELTMVLERNGEPVARWRASHRSNPLTQPAPDTDSTGDLVAFGMVNFFLPAVVGVPLARWRARKDLEDIVVGPQKSTLWWVGAIGVGLLAAASVLFYQFAVLLTALPALAGAAIAAVTYLGMLSLRDADTEVVEFDQRDIEDVADVTGDDRPAATMADKRLKTAYRRDNRLYLPDTGWLATIARKWADPAYLDLTAFESTTETTGDVDMEFSADPLADAALEVQPARLAFAPELVREATAEERDAVAESIAEGYDTHWTLGTIRGWTAPAGLLLKRVNWRLLAIAGAGLALGWAGGSALGIPYFGAALGAIPGLAAATRARDGTATFWPAPKHATDARAIMSVDGAEYEQARTFEELEEQLADQDLTGLEKGRQLVDAYRRELTEGIDRSLGLDADARNGDATAVDDGLEVADE